MNSIGITYRIVSIKNNNTKLPFYVDVDVLPKTDITNLRKHFSNFGFNYVINGILLKPIINDNKQFVSLPLKVKNRDIDFFNIIKVDISNFNIDSKFYLNIISNNKFIIINTNEISPNKVVKQAFNENGILINEVTDTLLPDKSILRTVGKNIFNINKGVIVYKVRKFAIAPIRLKYNKNKNNYRKNFKNISPNTNIGTFDIETYIDEESGIAKVFALGFYTSLDTKPTLYYIDEKTLDSSAIVLECINEMLISKYSDVTFYVHNFGGYDCVFILKILLEYNYTEKGKENHFDNFSISHFRYLSNSFNNESFLNIIPNVYTYTPSKNKVLVVYFSMLDLNTSVFKSTITSKVPKGFIYTVFIKIRYDYDSFFIFYSFYIVKFIVFFFIVNSYFY